MIRAVLDTNVIVSAILGSRRDESAPGAIYRAWIADAFALYISESIRLEVEHALGKPFFSQRVRASDVELATYLLSQRAHHIELVLSVSGVATHPEDDLILAAAASAAVDYLVTGDKMLLALETFQGVRIVSASHFVQVLRAEIDHE